MTDPNTNPADSVRAAHDDLIKKAAAEGRLLELGFLALAAQALQDASEGAVNAARLIYMAGAQHLFASMITTLDPGRRPTASDLNNITLIFRELQAIEPQLMAMTGAPSATDWSSVLRPGGKH